MLAHHEGDQMERGRIQWIQSIESVMRTHCARNCTHSDWQPFARRYPSSPPSFPVTEFWFDIILLSERINQLSNP